MVEQASSVVLNFKMDGQVKYAETLKQINSVMNVAAKEYKNHIVSMGKDGSATDKLSAEKKKLEIQMEGAQKRTKMLSAEFEAMSKDTSTTTDQLTKMQGKLLDSERAEIVLGKSLDRVNEGLSDQAMEARDAQEVMDSLKGETKLLEAEQKNLTSSFKLQKSELGEHASETEKSELAQKQLAAQMELTDRVVNNLEQQLDASKSAYGENSVEVMNLETKLNETKSSINKFTDSLDDIEDSSDGAGQGMEGLESKLSAQALFDTADALQGISDKLIEVGKASFDSSLQFGDSQTNLQANLGLTEDQAESLNEVVQNVFKNGVVDSVEEATEAVTLVKSAFEDLNDTELEELTNQISTMSKRTGTDVSENVRAADQLMKTMGYTAQESFDLIAAGYQDNLNASGDFTDTLVEYAPLFAEAGYSGEEMLSMLSGGMEGGARNTDLVADAVKELQIRMGDGTFEDNLESFSSGTKDAFQRWKDGEYTVEDVTNSIAEDLEKMSPTEQQEALSVLGSQFEDLGVTGSLSLLQIEDKFDDVNGSADEMSEKNPTEKLQSGFRELQDLLAPVGEKLVEFAIDTLPKIISAAESLYEWFNNLAEPLQTFISSFGGLTAVAIILAPIIATVVAGFIAFGSTIAIVIGVVIAVIGVISGIIAVIKNFGAITDWFSEKWGQFTAWLGEAAGKMKDAVVTKFNEMKDGAVTKFNELKDGAVRKFNELKDKGAEIIQKLKDSVINKATELKDGFVNKATEMKNSAVGKYEELKTKASNTVTTLKNNVVNKANEIKTGFVNKVTELKDGAVGKFNELKNSATRIFNNVKDAIMNPINKAKDLMRSAIETMKGFFDFEWSLPKIKTPKFSVSGGFDLNPLDGNGLSVPKIGVTWNAKGGIFTQPTIFGATGGRLQGAGEAGTEAVLPLNDETLGAIGKGISKSMAGGVTVHQNIHGNNLDAREAARLSKIYYQKAAYEITKG